MIHVYKNISELVTLESAYKKDGRRLTTEDLSIIKNGALAFNHENILWAGETNQLPEIYSNLPSKNLSGYVLTPELVDSHTHLVFGGNRSHEYTLKLSGADYEEIAKAGGGILHTVEQTRTLSSQDLYEISKKRIETIASYGIGTIEIKSGYALNYEDEKKCSQVINQLKNHFSPKIKIINTFMAAHAVPKEFNSSRDYLQKIVIPLMKDLNQEKIIDIVDIFHEQNYFSEEDVSSLFEESKKLGLPTKIHADEFNDNNGAG